MLYASETVSLLHDSDKIVIYGARIVAKEVAECFMHEPYNLTLECFMVSDMTGNPTSLLGLPVITIDEGEKWYRDALIVVAVLEKYQEEIVNNLKQHDFHHILPMGFESDIWSELRGNYVENLFEKSGKKYLTLENDMKRICRTAEAVHVYQVRSHVDKSIGQDLGQYSWEIPIQAGAALTDKVVCVVRDNVGENISYKNREYCELTALYWIWKNDRSDYIGLCHYRRHFALDEETIERLKTSDIDVVLTIPILNFPDVRSMYVKDHIESDWDTMLEALEVLQPKYYQTALQIQKGVYYYAYNMFIARRDIFDSYCGWLFPILQYIEDRCGKKEDIYQNRYIGFLAERLLSVFFIYHSNEWKIVHARKNFYL